MSSLVKLNGVGLSASTEERPRRVLVSAFTLIELLVVVCIVAVLAALLIPSLGSARNRGKSMTCVNNLRQIAHGFTMYASDYNGFMGTAGNLAHPYTWYKIMSTKGYLGAGQNLGTFYRAKVLCCPAEYVNGRLWGPVPISTPYYDYSLVGTSYSMNWFVDCGPAGGCIQNYAYLPRMGWFKGPDLCGPAQAQLITDVQDVQAGWEATMFWNTIDDVLFWPWNGSQSNYYYTFRHPNRTANMLYMDGHVQVIRHKIDGGGPNWRLLFSTGPP